MSDSLVRVSRRVEWEPTGGATSTQMRERAVARAAEPRLRQRRLAGRVIRLTWGRVEDFGSSRAFGRSGGDLASEFTTACQGAPGILSSDFGQRRAVTRETSFRPISSRGLGAAICDTQAGVPSARRLGAQLAFKDFDGSRDSAIHTKYRISLRGGTTRPVKARCVSPDRRDRPTGAHEGGRATHPKVQLRAFKLQQLKYTLLELELRGCWHQTCPPMDPPYDYWQDQPGSIHKSRQALVMFRKHMERGTGEDLAVIFCQETSVLSRTEFLESPP
ncbi:hypothetical protein Bca101_101696 [Brassica carinata]